MTPDHMQIRATAIVNDLTKVTDPAGALDVLMLAVYLVAVMTGQNEDDADELLRACIDVIAKRMANYTKDRETFVRSRGKVKDKDKQAKLIKAMLAMGMKP